MRQEATATADERGELYCYVVLDLRKVWELRAHSIDTEIAALPRQGAKDIRATLQRRVKAVRALLRWLQVIHEQDHTKITVRAWDNLARKAKIHLYYGVSFEELCADEPDETRVVPWRFEDEAKAKAARRERTPASRTRARKLVAVPA